MKVSTFQPLRQPPTAEQQDQKLKDVAALYEKQFLRELVKSMRSTVMENGYIQASNAEKIFREQMDQQNVEKWGDKGGIGLADVIYKQLIDKYGVALGIKKYDGAPKGPIAIDQKTKLTWQDQQPKAGTVHWNIRHATQGQLEKPLEVLSPYAGKLDKAWRLDAQTQALEIFHDNGMRSRLVFEGVKSPDINIGDHLDAGAHLGSASMAEKSLSWTLEQGAQPDLQE